MKIDMKEDDVVFKKRKFRISLYWFIPIIATLITLSIIWNNTINKGLLIELSMDDASGIETSKTLLKYKSVVIGKVEEVLLSNDYNSTKIFVRVDKEFEDIVNEDATFWLVKPRFGTTSISGLDTVLSGVYINMIRGKSDKPGRKFICSDKIPVETHEKGIIIKLVNETDKIISEGTNINYRGYNIGVVNDSTYDKNLNKIVYSAQIFDEYLGLVNDQSVFWVDPGLEVGLGSQGIKFSLPNINDLLAGSIKVDKFNNLNSESIKSGDTFHLYKSMEYAKYFNIKDHNPSYCVMVDNNTNIVEGAPVYLRGEIVGFVSDRSWFKNNLDILDYNKKIPVLFILDYQDETGHDDEFYIKVRSIFSDLLKNNKICAVISNNGLLTSSKSINLVLNDKKLKCESRVSEYRNIAVIPSVVEKNVTDNISSFTDKLNQIDVKSLSTSVNKTVDDVDKTVLALNKKINSLELNNSIKQLNKTLSSYDKNSEIYNKIIDVINKLNSTLNDLNPTIKKFGQKSNALIFEENSEDIQPGSNK